MKNDAQNIEKLVEQYLTYWNQSDIDGLVSMYAGNMQYHDLPSGEVVDYVDLHQFLRDTFALQEDQQLKLNQSSFIEGNSAFIYWTHSFISVDTGRNAKVNGVELIVFKDGLINSIHEFYEFQTTGSVYMPLSGNDAHREKMAKLGLNEDISKQLAKELLNYLDRDKPYLEPDLTLATVSEHLGYTRNQISFVINHVLNKTFYDLINGYRIDHAIEKMSRAEQNISILELGFDAGFNSVSGFYNAFKKQTDKTPAQYLRHLKS